MTSLISFLFGSFQTKRGRLRESVERKERREKDEVGQEDRLSEEKIEDAEKFLSKYVMLYLCRHSFVNETFELKAYTEGLKIR